MEKSLLTEKGAGLAFKITSLSEDIKAESDKTGMMIVRNVPCTILNEKNANGRSYSTSTMTTALKENSSKGLYEARSLLCTGNDHPETTYPKPIDSSHVVLGTKIVQEGGKDILLNDWLILPTRAGKDLKGLIEAGVTVGTSIRGLGRQNEQSGEIEDYEYLGTDVVGNPSAGTYASFSNLNESITVEAVPMSESLQECTTLHLGKIMVNESIKIKSASKSLVKGITVGMTGDDKVVIFKSQNYDNKGNVSGEYVDVTSIAGKDGFSMLSNNYSDEVMKKLGFSLDSKRKLLGRANKLLKESTTEKSIEEKEMSFDLEKAIEAFNTKHAESGVTSQAISDLLQIEMNVIQEGIDTEVFEEFKESVLGALPKKEERELQETTKVQKAKDEDTLNKASRHLEASELVASQLKEQNELLLQELENLKKYKESSGKVIAELSTRVKTALNDVKLRESKVDDFEKALTQNMRNASLKLLEDAKLEAKEAILNIEKRLEQTIQLGDLISKYFHASKTINESLVERLKKQQEVKESVVDTKTEKVAKKIESRKEPHRHGWK
jgi:hypothetical protein